MEKLKKSNLDKECEILILFDDITVDMLSNKNLNPIVTELFIRERKPNNIITQYYLGVTKNFRLNSTHYFILKIPSKQEL